MRGKSLKKGLWVVLIFGALLLMGISGKIKAMASTNNFIIVNQSLVKYVGTDKEVVIPEGIRVISESAFKNSTVEKVTIPYGVLLIEKSAFQNCKSLIEIIIPESVTELGFYTFQNCISLEIIDLPDSLIYIGDGCFENCTSLETILFPSQEVNIGYKALNNTAWLDNYDGDTVIVNHTIVLYRGKESQVTIPDDITIIGSGAYENCRFIKGVNIPYGVKEIRYSAFESCTALMKIVLPSSVIKVDSYTFGNCENLSSITIPKDVDIARSSLEGTKWMMNYQGDFAILNGILIGYLGSQSKVLIPDAVRVICTGAFNNTDLKEVTIPKTVSKIYYAGFNACKNLTKVIFTGKDVDFDNQMFYEGTENLIIYGQKGGTVEKFATSNHITFINQKLTKTKVTLYLDGDNTVSLNGDAMTGSILWESEDPLIAIVDQEGTVTAVNVGTTNIKATVNGITLACEIKVKIPYISKSKASVASGKTIRLNIIGTTGTITWASSDTSVAMVSTAGVVTAQKAGSVTITATINDMKYSCKVTVK